jgi:ArsR family transcriptional regulator, arsenate/arsenite/antimonite-responsive transcriptional repressor
MSLAHKLPDALPVSLLFKALGDETRVRIVALLAQEELCVCHIEAALALSQPNASRHLAILRNAQIVETRREANWVYYRIARQEDPGRRAQLRTLVSSFTKSEVLKKDVVRLLETKGPMKCQ